MNWRNVKLVWKRELQDQLRDRRTLFMVAVLPLLMYPLMGMTFFQLSQFMRQHAAKVLVLDADQLESAEGLPPLVVGDRFDVSLFDRPDQAGKITIEDLGPLPPGADGTKRAQEARARLTRGDLDAVVVFPSDFAERLSELRSQLKSIAEGKDAGEDPLEVPRPVVLFNSTKDASQFTYLRVERILSAWRKKIVGDNLSQSRVPNTVLRPFKVQREDVALVTAQKAGIWSKLLPFVVFVWALTGAFYPAVDLCAGEKERGTLETLLASPALRGEIVWGKLMTVTTFSIATALLNLLGIAATGKFITQQLAAAGPLAGAEGLGLPPAMSLLWIVLALPPIAALFSALSFACASFARSTKEGQYYFMPLFLLTMPLMLMPLSPGIELNLGNALVPVMGVVLMLRSLIEGDLLEAARYLLPVSLVTLACCLLAIKWAVSQFNQESVLFRGNERFELGAWLRSLINRPERVPTATMAIACVVLIFCLQFVLRTAMAAYPPAEVNFQYFALTVVLSMACVLVPALLVGLLLTRSARETFLLIRRPKALTLLLAALLAVCMHPFGLQLSAWIQQLYPMSEELMAQASGVTQVLTQASSPWMVLLLMAVLPAVCEELTFRGCILSGLKRRAGAPWAVVITAVLFGATHTIFQQSLSAACLGLLIGYLAVITGSIWPCITFHAVYNAMPLLLSLFAGPIEAWLEENPAAARLLNEQDGMVTGYHGVVTLAGLLAGALLLRGIRAAASRQAEGQWTTDSPAERVAPLGARLASGETSES